MVWHSANFPNSTTKQARRWPHELFYRPLQDTASNRVHSPRAPQEHVHELTFQNRTSSGLQMFGSNLQAPAVKKGRKHGLAQFAYSRKTCLSCLQTLPLRMRESGYWKTRRFHGELAGDDATVTKTCCHARSQLSLQKKALLILLR